MENKKEKKEKTKTESPKEEAEKKEETKTTFFSVKATDKSTNETRLIWKDPTTGQDWKTEDKNLANKVARTCNKEFGNETSYEVIENN